MLNYSLSAGNIKEVKNPLAEVERVMGKLQLKKIRTWGAENDTGDENYFKAPEDIAVDNNNHVYVVDSSLHCVKVFDEKARFIRKIGRRGQGPGDLLSPLRIAVDEANQIWVNDYGNSRIQTFSHTGVSLSIFKTSNLFYSKLIIPSESEVALLDRDAAGRGRGIVTVLNRSGAKASAIGIDILPPQIDRPFFGGKYDSHVISFDKGKKQYYVAYTCSQMIHKFRDDGKHISTIFYDTPVNSLRLAWDSKKKNYDLLNKPKQYSECVDAAVDSKSRLFIIITARLPKNNEKTSMLLVDGRIRYKPQAKNYPDKTDMYWFLVFAGSGRIIAAKALEVFCSGLYIHKDRIFILDKIFEKVIHEYRYAVAGE